MLSQDYAGISFNNFGRGNRVAIVSQEDSAVWVGNFDWEEMEFVGEGEVREIRDTSGACKKWRGGQPGSWIGELRGCVVG